MPALSDADRIFADTLLAEEPVRSKVPDELKDLHAVVLGSSDNATCGVRHTVVISGDAAMAAAFSRPAIAGLIVHEAAHIYLRAHKFQSPPDEDEEADRLACEWGLREDFLAWFAQYNRVRESLSWREVRKPP